MNENPKHTPGPWHAKRDGEVWNDDEAMFRPARNFDIITPSQTTYANAALIAAAPDMYEALRAALARFDEWDNREPCENVGEAIVFIEDVRASLGYFAALARAEGR